MVDACSVCLYRAQPERLLAADKSAFRLLLLPSKLSVVESTEAVLIGPVSPPGTI